MDNRLFNAIISNGRGFHGVESNIMNPGTTMKAEFLALALSGAAILLAGCGGGDKGQYAEDAQAVPTYKYPPSTGSPTLASYPPTTNAGAMAGQPAAAQSETIPPSPGPNYVWMPSYWTTGPSGGWETVRGHYVTRSAMSDEQLRAARGMLEQARIGASEKQRKRVDDAIDQINTALKSK
jgi:hypothetical protein